MLQNKKRILIVIGTRPEAIKMVPVFLELAQHQEFDVRICLTGQHRELVDEVVSLFKVPIFYDMNIMKSSQTLAEITSTILLHASSFLEKHNPDCVLIHGDTTTSLAFGMAAFYSGIRVGHVEAGLRSGNVRLPFPEEFNRRTNSLITEFHFAPTQENKNNLISENIDCRKIHVTGNTVIDALRIVSDRMDTSAEFRQTLENDIINSLGEGFLSNEFVLITLHRREILETSISHICTALKVVAKKNPSLNFVLPMHPNPVLQGKIKSYLDDISNFHLVRAFPYGHFCYLLKNCHFVITDSGGIQEEGPFLKKPVLVLREVTERPEAVAEGAVKLIGVEQEKIIQDIQKLIENTETFNQMRRSQHPYGDGYASQKICKILKENL